MKAAYILICSILAFLNSGQRVNTMHRAMLTLARYKEHVENRGFKDAKLEPNLLILSKNREFVTNQDAETHVYIDLNWLKAYRDNGCS